MKDKYLLDTCAIISYFCKSIQGATISLNKNILNEIKLILEDTENIIYIPSISLVEIHSKFSSSEENNGKIKSEVYQRLKNYDNVSIEGIDCEVLENFLKIRVKGCDFRDRLILAIAMKYQCILITSDGPLSEYAQKNKLVPIIK